MRTPYLVAAISLVMLCGAGGARGAWIQQAKLTAGDAASYDYLGYAVDLDADTAVAGAYGENSAVGSAYVFTRTGTSWAQQAKLTPSGGAAMDYFGCAVAVDGDTAVVGSFGDDSGKGSAYVFTRSGTSWSQQAKLTASDGAASDYFGYSVAVSGDSVVVGARQDDTSRGSAYVFTRSGTSWSQQAKLTAGDGAQGDWFGQSVALDGDTAAVGAVYDDNTGSAYVFTRSGASWSQQAKVTASDAAGGDNFGQAVGIDGDDLAVGADGGGGGGGAAYVFVRSGASWGQQAKLTAADAESGDAFGYSVGIDGDRIVAGARYEDEAGGNAGSAYVFERSGTSWSQQDKLMADDAAAGDELGYAVAVDGGSVLAGAQYDDHSLDAGSAYVFTPEPATLGLIAAGGVLLLLRRRRA